LPWTSRLKSPIKLKGGRSVETLADARTVILELPEYQQRRPYWEYTAQLLMAAAQGGKREAIDEAYWQLMRALKADRMLS
jgi:DNA-binding SARP family transcriptional activator